MNRLQAIMAANIPHLQFISKSEMQFISDFEMIMQLPLPFQS